LKLRVLLTAIVFVAGNSAEVVADLRAVIDISEQRMYVVQDREITHVWRVSTGKPGCRTPPGRYRPKRLERIWYSSKYESAPMPYSIFFHNGYAVHGTIEISKLGRPVSHGCARLTRQNARTLFNLVKTFGMARSWIIIRQ
jgi:lipoprotein-anchoring transpeptidase ErfK/SrfK